MSWLENLSEQIKCVDNSQRMRIGEALDTSSALVDEDLLGVVARLLAQLGRGEVLFGRGQEADVLLARQHISVDDNLAGVLAGNIAGMVARADADEPAGQCLRYLLVSLKKNS